MRSERTPPRMPPTAEADSVTVASAPVAPLPTPNVEADRRQRQREDDEVEGVERVARERRLEGLLPAAPRCLHHPRRRPADRLDRVRAGRACGPACRCSCATPPVVRLPLGIPSACDNRIRCDARHGAARNARSPLLTWPFPATFRLRRGPIPPDPGNRRKDLKPMHAKTALAVAGSVLAVPSAALAATHDTCPRPRAPASGRLTLDADTRPASCARTCASPAAPHLSDSCAGYARRLRMIRSASSAAATDACAARSRGSSPPTPSATARGDRRLRVRRQPGHEHRQRVLRQVPVHAATWQSVGGTGNPAAACEAEQDRRAAQLYAQRGRRALAGLRPVASASAAAMAFRDAVPGPRERSRTSTRARTGPLPRAAHRAGRSRARRAGRAGPRVRALRAPATSCRTSCATATRG